MRTDRFHHSGGRHVEAAREFIRCLLAGIAGALVGTSVFTTSASAQTPATLGSQVHDPGVRGGPAGAGGPLPELNAGEKAFFAASRDVFQEIELRLRHDCRRGRQGPRPALQHEQLQRLPFAARRRRHQPGGQSAGRGGDAARREEQAAAVHHAQWSGARSPLRQGCARHARRRRARPVRDHRPHRCAGLQHRPAGLRLGDSPATTSSSAFPRRCSAPGWSRACRTTRW